MPERAISPAPVQSPDSALLALLPEILHEMSQPLGVLRCAFELAQMHNGAGEKAGDLKLWLQQAERLTELLEIIRELTEIERCTATPAECELAGLTRAILNDLRPVAHERQVTLRLESPRPVHARANDQRTYHALEAVLMNAIERANAGESLCVNLRQVKSEAWISISGLRPQPGDWPTASAPAGDFLQALRAKRNWPLLLAQCTFFRAGGMIQCDPVSGGYGNLLIRLPLAR